MYTEACGWHGRIALLNFLKAGLKNSNMLTYLAEWQRNHTYKTDKIKAIQDFMKFSLNLSENDIVKLILRQMTVRITKRLNLIRKTLHNIETIDELLLIKDKLCQVIVPIFFELLAICDCEPVIVIINEVFNVIYKLLAVYQNNILSLRSSETHITTSNQFYESNVNVKDQAINTSKFSGKNMPITNEIDQQEYIFSNDDMRLFLFLQQHAIRILQLRSSYEVGEIIDIDYRYMLDLIMKIQYTKNSFEIDSTSYYATVNEFEQFYKSRCNLSYSSLAKYLAVEISGIFSDNTYYKDKLAYSLKNSDYLSIYYLIRSDRLFFDVFCLIIVPNYKNKSLIYTSITKNSHTYRMYKNCLYFFNQLLQGAFNITSFEIRALIKSFNSIIETTLARPDKYSYKDGNFICTIDQHNVNFATINMLKSIQLFFNFLMPINSPTADLNIFNFTGTKDGLNNYVDNKKYYRYVYGYIGSRHVTKVRVDHGSSNAFNKKFLVTLNYILQENNINSFLTYINNTYGKLYFSYKVKKEKLTPTSTTFDIFMLVQSPQMLFLLIKSILITQSNRKIKKYFILSLWLPLIARINKNLNIGMLLSSIFSIGLSFKSNMNDFTNLDFKNIASINNKTPNNQKQDCQQSNNYKISKSKQSRIFFSIDSICNSMESHNLSFDTINTNTNHKQLLRMITNNIDVDLLISAIDQLIDNNFVLFENKIHQYSLSVNDELSKCVNLIVLQQLKCWFIKYYMCDEALINNSVIYKYILSIIETDDYIFNDGFDIDLGLVVKNNSNVSSILSTIRKKIEYEISNINVNSFNCEQSKFFFSYPLIQLYKFTVLYDRSIENTAKRKILNDKFIETLKYIIEGPTYCDNCQNEDLDDLYFIYE